MYLDVEQVRFGQRLRVSMHTDDRCANWEVPPLLVQPLVENAVKHGIASMAEGGEIRFQTAWTEDGIRFVIENPYDPDARTMRNGGIGLRNVRDRLTARYGSAASMSVEPEIGRYKVTLRIPAAAKGGER